ncbi:tRNA (guanosine(37)-N1)-methyltransferase TrmD [Acetobacter orientalis]|uniref:tRNA (guanosine(37)-N1)-methyltransferase TrmD n=1 Tax=Acetobacter orientalis TaxID=146474 RepID=UPI0039E8B2AF
MSWQATVLTLFPEMFPGPLGLSLAGRALDGGVWSCATHDLRQHGLGRHRAVDDTPFGGGAGMVIRADVADAALSAIDAPQDMPRVFLTPRGYPLRQKDVSRYAQGPGVVLICGRFEGVDERVLKAHSVEQVSIGDYVLSGGETAALVLLDACVRLLPGVMGSDASGVEESFSDGLLEYPHYTRPATWQGQDVPEVLLSGNHAAIAAWRQKQAEEITRERRPDLWSAWLARREKNEAAAGVSGKVRQTGV